MAVTMDVVRIFDAYTRWADARMLEAVEALPAGAWLRDIGGSFGSIRNTAVHLVSAQRIWLSRWQGRPPAPMWTPEEVPTPDVLRARWTELARERLAFLADQTDEALAKEVRYTTTDGKAHANPLGELFLHMANHSTYHRGQVTTLLRMAGVKPPAGDLIAWIRAGKP